MSVRRAAIPVAIWATYLTGLGLMLALWDGADIVSVILFGWAALITFAIAGWIALHGRDAVAGDPPARWTWLWALPLAAGVGAIVSGLQAGLWLTLIGLGFVLVGAAGLWRRV